jgi:hypothetical protein
MAATVPDPVWWTLCLSDALGQPSYAEVRRWSLPEIAGALVVDEAVRDARRYAAQAAGVK